MFCNTRWTVRVSELEEKIGKNDPPPWVKPNSPPRSQRAAQKQNRKRRPHAFIRKRLDPTDTIYHVPDNCPDCNRALKGGWKNRIRHVIDLPQVKAPVTDHVVVGRHCGVCGKNWVPKLDLSADVLGDEVKGTLVCDFYGGYNYVRCLRPRCRVHFLRDLHKLRLENPERTEVVDWVDKVIALYREAISCRQECLAAPLP